MSRFGIHYDEKEDVIELSVAGLTLTPLILSELRAELQVVAAQLPHRVFLLTCWEATLIDSTLTGEEYARHIEQALKIMRGTTCYGATNPFTNIFLRTTTVQYGFQGHQSHIYLTREEALAAIHKLELEAPLEVEEIAIVG